MHELDGRAGVANAGAPTREDLLIDARVQTLKAIREFKLLALVRHRPVGITALVPDVFWQVLNVGRKEPTDSRPFEREHSSHFARTRKMNLVRFDVAEEPQQQVEKVD